MAPVGDLIPTLEDLGIGLVPFSPLGKSFLTDEIDEDTTFDDSDFRNIVPRFFAGGPEGQSVPGGAAQADRRAEGFHLGPDSTRLGAGPKAVDRAQPGTTKRSHLEDTIEAARLELTPDDLGKIEQERSNIEVVGARYLEELEERTGR